MCSRGEEAKGRTHMNFLVKAATKTTSAYGSWKG